jgi:hypothetical protein
VAQSVKAISQGGIVEIERVTAVTGAVRTEWQNGSRQASVSLISPSGPVGAGSR